MSTMYQQSTAPKAGAALGLRDVRETPSVPWSRVNQQVQQSSAEDDDDEDEDDDDEEELSAGGTPSRFLNPEMTATPPPATVKEPSSGGSGGLYRSRARPRQLLRASRPGATTPIASPSCVEDAPPPRVRIVNGPHAGREGIMSDQNAASGRFMVLVTLDDGMTVSARKIDLIRITPDESMNFEIAFSAPMDPAVLLWSEMPTDPAEEQQQQQQPRPRPPLRHQPLRRGLPTSSRICSRSRRYEVVVVVEGLGPLVVEQRTAVEVEAGRTASASVSRLICIMRSHPRSVRGGATILHLPIEERTSDDDEDDDVMVAVEQQATPEAMQIAMAAAEGAGYSRRQRKPVELYRAEPSIEDRRRRLKEVNGGSGAPAAMDEEEEEEEEAAAVEEEEEAPLRKRVSR